MKEDAEGSHMKTQFARNAPRQSKLWLYNLSEMLDAIRKECAEAKRGNDWFVFPVFRALRNFSGETRMLWRIFPAEINLPLKRHWYFQSLLQGDFFYCFVIFRRSGQIWHRLRAFPPGEALWL